MLFAEALQHLVERGASVSLESEGVPLSEAVGRVLAADLSCAHTLPPFTNSAMDGFALTESALERVRDGESLSICGQIFPGNLPPPATPQNSVWEIMTGAPVPSDAVSVVKVEDTNISEIGRLRTVRIKQLPETGANLRAAGGDFKKGSPLLKAGTRIRPEHLMGLAAQGLGHVSVKRRPRLVLVPTGRELLAPGDEYRQGLIYNSTSAYLSHALSEYGADVELHPIIPDDTKIFQKFMRNLQENPPDILVTTGAVSMGQADFLRPAFEAMGAHIIFHRIEIRPGKPILFAQWNLPHKTVHIFGLPGNPISGVVGSRFLIEPYIRVRMGHEMEKPWSLPLAQSVSKPSHLRCFFKADIVRDDDRVSVQISPGQGSHLIHPLMAASSWAVLPEGPELIEAGTRIDVYPQWPASPFHGGLGE